MERSLRICVLAHELRCGGGRTIGLNLIPELRRAANQHRFWWTLPDDPAFRQIAADLQSDEVRFEKDRSLLSRLFAETVLPRQLQRFRPDIVFALGNRGLIDPPCPQALYLHRGHLVYPRSTYRGNSLRTTLVMEYHRAHLSRSLHRTQLVVCQTALVASKVRATHGYRGDTLVSAPPPSALLKPNAEPSTSLPDKFKLLCLGNYHGHKGLETVVELFAKHREALSGVAAVLTISDDLKQAQHLLSTIRREHLQESVINLGPVPHEEVGAYLANCQALLMPTHLETFGLPYVEAMNAGLPILTSDLEFAHTVCGKAALYFNPISPTAILDQILILKTSPDLRDRLAEAGRDRVNELCSTWPGEADRIVRSLEALSQDFGFQASAGSFYH